MARRSGCSKLINLLFLGGIRISSDWETKDFLRCKPAFKY